MEDRNPKKRKINDSEETKNASTESDEPFSFYSLLNIPKTATIEEIVKKKIFFFIILMFSAYFRKKLINR